MEQGIKDAKKSFQTRIAKHKGKKKYEIICRAHASFQSHGYSKEDCEKWFGRKD